MPNSRGSGVLVTLVAALLIPRVQKWTGVKLETDDVVALMALSYGAWQGIAHIFTLYFPPKGDSNVHT